MGAGAVTYARTYTGLRFGVRDEEAERLTAMSARIASDDDFTSQITWRVARARVVGDQGIGTEAKSLAQEAVELAEQTDCPNLRGDAWLSLAHARAANGELDGAEQAAKTARDQFLAKGNTVMAERSAGLVDYARGVSATTSGRSFRR